MRLTRSGCAKCAILVGGLGFIGWQLYQAPFVQEFLVSQSPRLGSYGIPIIQRSLGHDDNHVRMAAMEALKQFGSDAIPQLIENLSDADERVKSNALQALAILGEDSRPAAPFLVQKFNEFDPLSRARILRLFAVFRETADDRKMLILQSLKDANSEVRTEAAETIGALYWNCPEQDIVDGLVERLGDSNLEVRAEVREALERLSAAGDIVVVTLTRITADSKSSVQSEAAEFLRTFNSKKVK